MKPKKWKPLNENVIVEKNQVDKNKKKINENKKIRLFDKIKEKVVKTISKENKKDQNSEKK